MRRFRRRREQDRGGWRQGDRLQRPAPLQAVEPDELERQYARALDDVRGRWAEDARAAAGRFLATGSTELVADGETLTLTTPVALTRVPRPARARPGQLYVEVTSARRGCTDLVTVDPTPAALTDLLLGQLALAQALTRL